MIDIILEHDDSLSISKKCACLSISRATFYRKKGSDEIDKDIDLRHQIQLIVVDMPFYGYRRVTKELVRRGFQINHKRVIRLLREDNLLCLRKKRFVVATTDSNHCLETYPNLARYIQVNRINQLWVSDITYVRLQREFVYVAVVLDVFSRRCVGWNIGRNLDAALALGALDMAFETRKLEPNLIHHSDRGVQYASNEYVQKLKNNGITISMSRPGNPYDNAYAESFMKTLKYEEVYLWEYETLDDARINIGNYIDEVYNLKRLHSAIGYLPPAEYEQVLTLAQDHQLN